MTLGNGFSWYGFGLRLLAFACMVLRLFALAALACIALHCVKFYCFRFRLFAAFVELFLSFQKKSLHCFKLSTSL